MTARGKKPGRPSIYSKALAETICRRIAEGKSLRSICSEDDMPAISTVMLWLFDDKHDEFSERYAQARRAQAELRADEIVDLADDSADDWTTDEKGKPIVDHEHIARSRLRVDARKWIASKLLPKVYGDKVQHTGEGGGPVTFVMNLHRDE